MDPKGDHGGDSENEVNAALFLYSKSPIWDTSASESLSTIVGKLEAATTASISGSTKQPIIINLSKYSKDMQQQPEHTAIVRTIPQIDLVPTISTLLGVPIPFGNLGSIIPELFYFANDKNGSRRGGRGRTAEWQREENLVQVARTNAAQIFTYLTEYSSHRKGMADEFQLEKLARVFQEAEQLYDLLGLVDDEVNQKHYDSSIQDSERREAIGLVIVKYMEFMRISLESARRVWARFDVSLIVIGLVTFLAVLAFSVFTVAMWWRNLDGKPLTAIAAFFTGGCFGGVVVAGSGVVKILVGFLLRSFDVSDSSGLTKKHEATVLGVFAAIAGFVVVSIWGIRGSRNDMKDSSSHSPLSFSQWFLGLSLLILWAGVPASDSFTIYEESVTVHLLQTFGLYMVVIGINSRHPAVQNTIVLNSVLFMILTRVSQTSTVCREEKAQTCFPTFNALPNSSVASPFAVLGLIVLIPVVLITVRRALSSTDSLHGTGYFIVTYSLPAGLFVSFVYWLLDTLHGYQQFVGGWEFMQTIKIWWAKVLFLACSVSALYVWGCEPSCLGVAELTITAQTPTKTGTAAAENNNRDGSILVDKATQKEYVILGLQNPLGSAYLVFVSIVYMILAMFQKPMGGVMLGIQIIQIVGLVEIYTLLRDEWEPNLGLESSFVTMQAKLFQSAHTSSPSESANPEKSSNKFREEGKKPTPFSLLFLFTVVLLIQGQRFFFATGHQYTLASIQWDVAFIGLFNTSFVWGPVIMLFNTFGAPLLSLLAIPLLPLWKQRRDVVALAGSGNGSGNKSRDHVILRDIGAVFLIVGLCLGVWGFAATAFVGHFRRHLMVWSVFAPKFLGVDMGVIVLEGFLILFVGAAVARVWMLK